MERCGDNGGLKAKPPASSHWAAATLLGKGGRRADTTVNTPKLVLQSGLLHALELISPRVPTSNRICYPEGHRGGDGNGGTTGRHIRIHCHRRVKGCSPHCHSMMTPPPPPQSWLRVGLDVPALPAKARRLPAPTTGPPGSRGPPQAEDTCVRPALRAREWDRWPGHVVLVLRVAVAWVENRLLWLVGWGVEFARDFGIPNFLSELQGDLDLLEPQVRLSLLHDSTSPQMVLLPNVRASRKIG